MSAILEPLHRTLDQELAAILRGARLECPVCGEFLLHRADGIGCPQCGLEIGGAVAAAGGLEIGGAVAAAGGLEIGGAVAVGGLEMGREVAASGPPDAPAR